MCNMTNEAELFEFCFGNDLLTLGWIHVSYTLLLKAAREYSDLTYYI